MRHGCQRFHALAAWSTAGRSDRLQRDLPLDFDATDPQRVHPFEVKDNMARAFDVPRGT
jgi:hypothetical protein